jgi:D-glycero-alpha-D-manno-heptose-7-phosphate kinase
LVSVEGSVRVDLLGGTLDISPINLILKNALTLNVATSLKAKVEISDLDKEGVEIHSLDYKTTKYFPSEDFSLQKLESGAFGPFTFLGRILFHLKVKRGISLRLSSGSPPGAGLGGSSAMGVTFFKALLKYLGDEASHEEIVRVVGNIEAKSLDCGPTGYQDYYPALYGGILALIPEMKGVKVEQLFTRELANSLENHLTLVSSEESRFSGLNNWEVIKKFFDKDPKIRDGLKSIANLTFKAYKALQQKDYASLFKLISLEGEQREKLFPHIVAPSIKELFIRLQRERPHLGMKVCGAGGGGCFLLVHKPEDQLFIRDYIKEQTKMRVLPLKVDDPLQ